jgi:hypothetical protein
MTLRGQSAAVQGGEAPLDRESESRVLTLLVRSLRVRKLELCEIAESHQDVTARDRQLLAATGIARRSGSRCAGS